MDDRSDVAGGSQIGKMEGTDHPICTYRQGLAAPIKLA